jgi:ABC-type transporter Mla MlaB component
VKNWAASRAKWLWISLPCSRIDAIALSAMAEFADIADSKGVKVVLRGVNVGVYKVLKLVKLASRFSFVS